MSEDPRFAPIWITVGRSDPPVRLRLKQLDGLYRVAFSCEAAEIAAAIDRGEAEGRVFGVAALASLPVEEDAAARARRFAIEMTLAVEWAWIEVEGVSADGMWGGQKHQVAQLVRFGDPELDVPPLFATLGQWFNGALVLVDQEGERFGPSLNGDGAAGPSTAKGVVH